MSRQSLRGGNRKCLFLRSLVLKVSLEDCHLPETEVQDCLNQARRSPQGSISLFVTSKWCGTPGVLGLPASWSCALGREGSDHVPAPQPRRSLSECIRDSEVGTLRAVGVLVCVGPLLCRTQDRGPVCARTQQLLSTGLWVIVPGNLVQGSLVDIDGGTEVARMKSFCSLN